MKVVGALLLVGMLTGCTTMQHLDDVGEDYSKGNYISGTALLVFITPFTLIADIFTFGGSMDAEQSSAVWTGAATQYAQNEAAQQQQAALRQQQYLQQQQAVAAAAAAEAARQQEWNEQNQRILDRQQQERSLQAENLVLASASSSANTSTGGAKKSGNSGAPFIQPGSCADFRNGGTGITSDVKKLRNGCGRPIAVRFCFYDSKNPTRCAGESVGWGVTGTIGPGGETTVINPLVETAGIPWKVEYRVCDMSDASKMCLKP